MYRRGRISNKIQHWVLGGVCRCSFDVCLHLHLPFISWRDWWSVFRRVSQQQSWSVDLRGNNSEVRGPQPLLNDPQLPKTWKVFVSRHFWVHFCPRYRESQGILVYRGFRICMTKGGRESKMPGYGNFQSVPCYRKGTDQKPPIIRHFWLPTPLLPYKFWTLWT